MAKAFFIPDGPKNLEAIFGFDFSQVASYEVVILNGGVLATTPLYDMRGDCMCEDKVRIHFLNYLGGVDAVNFCIVVQEHETKSDSYYRTLEYPLEKRRHGGNRFNVKSNDIYTLRNSDYTEKEKDWLDEMFDSPLSWMEWKGTDGQADNYIPMIVLDGTFEKVKQDDRYIYETTLKVKLSNERIILRN